MNTLLVDVGNSKTLVARLTLVPGGSIGPMERIWTGETSREDAAAIAARVAGLRGDGDVVGLVSVVPVLTDALRAAMPDLRCVDHRVDFPFGVSIDNPETVGADRWCNVAAAVDAGCDHAIVVDAGTATTIDVLENGVFVGGFIAPGMAFAARKLQEEAARLWTVPFEPVPLAPGRDTDTALAAGAFHVGVCGVAGVVEALLEDRPDARVVLTGGLGKFLVRPDWRYDADWTLRGLAVLLQR